MRERSAPALGFAAYCSFSAAGCATYNGHLAATPTPASSTDFAVTADALVVDRGLGPELLAAPDVSIRRGLGRDWDIGLRLFPLGGELTARHRLLDGSLYDLALVPLLAGGVVTFTNADTSFFMTSAGVVGLNGFRLDERTELTFGVRSALELGLNAVAVREDFSAARFRLVTGGSVALGYRAGERWSLSPAVVVLVPYDLDRSESGPLIVQGGFSVTW